MTTRQEASQSQDRVGGQQWVALWGGYIALWNTESRPPEQWPHLQAFQDGGCVSQDLRWQGRTGHLWLHVGHWPPRGDFGYHFRLCFLLQGKATLFGTMQHTAAS